MKLVGLAAFEGECARENVRNQQYSHSSIYLSTTLIICGVFVAKHDDKKTTLDAIFLFY